MNALASGRQQNVRSPSPRLHLLEIVESDAIASLQLQVVGCRAVVDANVRRHVDRGALLSSVEEFDGDFVFCALAADGLHGVEHVERDDSAAAAAFAGRHDIAGRMRLRRGC